MFDIGWLELIIIGIVALIVVGPNDLPGMFRTVGQFMGKMRGMAREFQRAMDDAAKESGLKEAADSLNKIHDVTNPTKSAKSFAKDLMKDADLEEIEADIQNAMTDDPKPEVAAPPAPKTSAAPAPEPGPPPQAKPTPEKTET